MNLRYFILAVLNIKWRDLMTHGICEKCRAEQEIKLALRRAR